MIPSPVNLSTVPPYRCTTAAQRSTSSAMISRSRSAPTAAAMSIECTTSANSTVTCLYSADRVACVTGAPHSLQNLEFGWQLGAARPTGQPRRGQSTATIPAGVHVSIVSPLVNDVRHIAVPSPTRSFETLVCRLFRDGVQFCSGLVDLVVGVGHHGGGGHRLTLAGERFVGLVAEDIAEVGDRGAEFGEGRCGRGD